MALNTHGLTRDFGNTLIGQSATHFGWMLFLQLMFLIFLGATQTIALCCSLVIMQGAAVKLLFDFSMFGQSTLLSQKLFEIFGSNLLTILVCMQFTTNSWLFGKGFVCRINIGANVHLAKEKLLWRGRQFDLIYYEETQIRSNEARALHTHQLLIQVEYWIQKSSIKRIQAGMQILHSFMWPLDQKKKRANFIVKKTEETGDKN